MRQLDKVSSLRETVTEWKRVGQRVALVPTMGNLHAGHLSLVDKARQTADRVVVSVFVNPLQFGPNEDFDRYPRTYEQDCAYLREKGVDAVFAPSVEEMYPNGQEQTLVVAPSHLTRILEGAIRPGHFDGVTTVVNKLFNMVQPDVAVFGQKDFQQVAVLKRMVDDLSLPVELIRAEIMRDADGLALSSRNQYLDEAQRRIAPKLFVVLQSVRMAIESENDHFRALEATATQQLLAEGFDAVDYVTIRQADSLEPVDCVRQNCVILAAARLGETRLLDNVLVTPR